MGFEMKQETKTATVFIRRAFAYSSIRDPNGREAERLKHGVIFESDDAAFDKFRNDYGTISAKSNYRPKITVTGAQTRLKNYERFDRLLQICDLRNLSRDRAFQHVRCEIEYVVGETPEHPRFRSRPALFLTGIVINVDHAEMAVLQP